MAALPSSAGLCHQVLLKERPTDKPSVGCFEVKSLPRPTCVADGDVLVRVLYLSVDPYMRGRIGGDASRSSRQPLSIGGMLPGATVGEVVESRYASLLAGDVVHAYSGWTDYYVANGSTIQKCDVDLGVPLVKHLGVLGMTGLTAYYGLNFVGEAKYGDVLVVSAAAGAVGSIVVQLGKIKGCFVVGIVGSEPKAKWLMDELKCDGVVNYKSPEGLKAQLDRALGARKVDVYYDNTGGEISDHIIQRINRRARIIICGQISTYNTPDGEPPMGPRLLHNLLWKSARMQGFLVQDYLEHDAKTIVELAGYLRDGRLQAREDIVEGGLQAAPVAFLRLFDGSNTGKIAVHISDPSSALTERLNKATAAAIEAAKNAPPPPSSAVHATLITPTHARRKSITILPA